MSDQSAFSAEDRQAVEDVLLRYTWALDTHQWDELRSVFTDDAMADYSDPKLGQRPMREIIDLFMELSSGGIIRSAQHYVTNQLVTKVDEDTAHSRAFYLCMWVLEPGTPDGDITFLGGKYDLDVVRTPSGWKLKRMHAVVEWDHGNRSMTDWVRTG